MVHQQRVVLKFVSPVLSSLLVAGIVAILWLPASADDAKVAVPVKLDLPPKPFTENLPDGIKLEMVYIPGGEYLMGSPNGEPGRAEDEGPQHKVQIKPFWLGKYEVRWDEYDIWWKNESLPQPSKDPPFSKNADAITRPTNPYVPEDYNHGREGYPALCMSHHAAMMYCHWMRSITKKGYRLPTEAEWEYACRAGTTTAYSFGANPETIGDYAQFKGNSPDEDHFKGTTAKCGTKKPNAFGLYDMHGNVTEWCLDYYDAKFYAQSASEKLTLSPVNKPTDRKWGHVARGGSFKDLAEACRSAVRKESVVKWMYKDPQSPRSIWWLTNMDQIGFRVALPVEEQDNLIGIKPMVIKRADHDPVIEDDDGK